MTKLITKEFLNSIKPYSVNSQEINYFNKDGKEMSREIVEVSFSKFDLFYTNELENNNQRISFCEIQIRDEYSEDFKVDEKLDLVKYINREFYLR